MSEQESKQQSIEKKSIGPGQALRKARLQKNLEIKQVSSKLKLMEKYILDIENDAYSSDTPKTFYRGYVKNYAEFLEVNSEALIEQFVNFVEANNIYPSAGPRFVRVAGKPNKSPYALNGKLIGQSIKVIGILLAVFLAYYLLIEVKLLNKVFGGKKSEQNSEQSLELNDGQTLSLENNVSSSSDINSVDEPLSLPINLDSNADKPEGNSTSNLKPPVSEVNSLEQVPVSVVNQNKSINSPITDGAINNNNDLTASSSLPSVQTVQNEIVSTQLSLSFNDECWIKIVDATGRVLIVGTKQAGQTSRASGPAPFEITLGKASAVEITYAGEIVDLSQYKNSNFAKLTIGD